MEARGRPAGPRARGRPPQGQQKPQGPSPQGPPQGAVPKASLPPQQSAWAARGTPSGPAPRQQPRQAAPAQAVTQQMQAMNIGAGDASQATPARGTGEVSRGGMRQRPVEALTYMFKNSSDLVKQGKDGTPVTLKSNYFKFNAITNVALYQYRVDFQPDEDRTGVRKAMLRVHKDSLGHAYIFDGTVLFTLTKLNDNLELTMKRKDDQIVQILIKKTVDLYPGDVNYTAFLNNILRNCFAQMDMKLIGRNYFDYHNVNHVPNFNLEIWPGYVSSVRQHENSLLLSVDLSFKVLRHETAYQLLEDCKARAGNKFQDVFLEAILRTVVITRYNNRTYEIDDVDFSKTPSSLFDMKGEKVSLKQYYLKKYQIQIKYDHQPLLVSRAKAKRDQAQKSEILLLIPELCCLTGITDSMRANFHLMEAIAKHTRVPPSERVNKLESGFMTNLMTKCRSELETWNMAFEKRLIEFPGRVLAPEKIIIGGGKNIIVDANTGDFTRLLTGRNTSGLNRPAHVDCWAIIYTHKQGDQVVREFCEVLTRASRTLSLNVPQPKYEPIPDDRIQSYLNAIERCINNKAKLIMCVVPNQRADRYEAIKKKCYISRPVPNQVVVSKNVNKKNMSVATKIAIQMSAKLGGVPWYINVPFKTPTMIVGFDVCHSGRSKGGSFGAMVATMDREFTRYFSCVQPHDGKVELCSYIGAMLLKAVVRYRENNQNVPEKIIMYRDGIGEGNIHHCLIQEVGDINNTLQPLYPDRKVPLTFIVVSKRLNTRIFMNNGNPPPGTVVDSTITLPTMYDFFLISQSVNQGTVSPTSYNIIYDALNLKPDVAQQLTYKLCHMYFNWSGTIRLPAPCQYAHKLAFMAGQFLHQCPPANSMDEILYFL